jgi:hypothetical protein
MAEFRPIHVVIAERAQAQVVQEQATERLNTLDTELKTMQTALTAALKRPPVFRSCS